MKAVALSFLLGATVLFAVCTWLQARGGAYSWTGPWVGYVRAAAEAGMVGGGRLEDPVLEGDAQERTLDLVGLGLVFVWAALKNRDPRDLIGSVLRP